MQKVFRARERLVCDQLPCMTYLTCIFSTLRIGKMTPDSLPGALRGKHDYGHTEESNGHAKDIPHRRPHGIYEPEPEDSDRDIHPSIRRIDAARRRRVERQEPRKEGEATG